MHVPIEYVIMHLVAIGIFTFHMAVCEIRSHEGKKEELSMNRAYLKFKYAFGFLLALIGVIALSPLMAAVAIAIKAEDGGTVIFKQRRTGAGGKKIQLL